MTTIRHLHATHNGQPRSISSRKQLGPYMSLVREKTECHYNSTCLYLRGNFSANVVRVYVKLVRFESHVGLRKSQEHLATE